MTTTTTRVFSPELIKRTKKKKKRKIGVHYLSAFRPSHLFFTSITCKRSDNPPMVTQGLSFACFNVIFFFFIYSGSQNNLNICNGSIVGSVSEKHGLVRKVPNEMSGQKKPTVSLALIFIGLLWWWGFVRELSEEKMGEIRDDEWEFFRILFLYEKNFSIYKAEKVSFFTYKAHISLLSVLRGENWCREGKRKVCCFWSKSLLTFIRNDIHKLF